MNILGSASGRVRKEKLHAIYNRGQATSREILEAEFGHFPPTGLDYRPTNHLDTAVSIRSHFQDKKMGVFSKAISTVGVAGYVYGKEHPTAKDQTKSLIPEEQNIFINKALLGSVGRVALGAIGASLAVRFLSDLSVSGMVDFLKGHQFLALTMFATSLRHLPLTHIYGISLTSRLPDTLGHEHIHILQIHDKNRANTRWPIEDNHFKNGVTENFETFSRFKKTRKFFDDALSLNMSRYLLNDVEIQARLHTVLVHGYERWGKLPENRAEFFAACVDAGLNVPKKFREEIDATLSPEEKKTFIKPGLSSTFMRHARGFTNAETAELNAAQRSIMDETFQHKHWDETMPFLYGHLLELYGDPGGRKKMQYTTHMGLDGAPIPRVQIFMPDEKIPAISYGT